MNEKRINRLTQAIMDSELNNPYLPGIVLPKPQRRGTVTQQRSYAKMKAIEIENDLQVLEKIIEIKERPTRHSDPWGFIADIFQALPISEGSPHNRVYTEDEALRCIKDIVHFQNIIDHAVPYWSFDS